MIALALFPAARADQVSDLQKNIDEKNREIQQLQQQAATYQAQLSSKNQESKSIKTEITKINNAIKGLRGDIIINEKQLQKTQLEIKAKGMEISNKEASIRKVQSGLSSVIQIMAESDKESPIKVLLAKNSLSGFFNQIDRVEYLQGKMVDTINQLQSLQADLKVQKADAQQKAQELNTLQTTLQGRKKVNEGLKGDKNQLLSMTQSEAKKYQAMLDQTEQQQQDILKEVEDMENSLRKLVNPNSLPPIGKSIFLKPVGGRLTQGYGITAFAKARDFYTFHNGVDFAAPVGTPVAAADDGVILGTGNTDLYCPHVMYGKYIVLKHNNNLDTMYGHLSLIAVSVGQTIRRGDIIGYTGMTGLTTGPHLHFTVYDANTLEIRKGPKGICGLLPYGGSVNPLDYL